jgi:hypothetical protein
MGSLLKSGRMRALYGDGLAGKRAIGCGGLCNGDVVIVATSIDAFGAEGELACQRGVPSGTGRIGYCVGYLHIRARV